MINFNHPLPREKKAWGGQSLNDRQLWTADLFIVHPQIKRILLDFAKRLEHCERANKYQTMFIIGGSGAGKSTLASRMSQIANQRYSKTSDEKTICPVLQFRVPDPCSPYEFAVAILKALGEDNPRARKSRGDTIDAAEKFLKDCEVKVILIDNFQDIPERRAERGIEIVGSRIRNFIDVSTALWVFLGTGTAKPVINNEDQLIRRVAYNSQLSYFSAKNQVDKAYFKRILFELDKWLPLSEESCLLDSNTVTRMFLATEGIFDRIIQIVDRAWVEAVESGRELMGLKDLEHAFAYVYGPDLESINPFAKNFVPQSLRGKGQPFEYLKGGESC